MLILTKEFHGFRVHDSHRPQDLLVKPLQLKCAKLLSRCASQPNTKKWNKYYLYQVE